jgi:hypothetical protein
MEPAKEVTPFEKVSPLAEQYPGLQQRNGGASHADL